MGGYRPATGYPPKVGILNWTRLQGFARLLDLLLLEGHLLLQERNLVNYRVRGANSGFIGASVRPP